MLNASTHTFGPPDRTGLKPERFTVLIAAFLLSLIPLSNDEMWWHIVRGHAVVEGEFGPSQWLLVNEYLANSDWLNGTIPWIVFSTCGIAGLMLMKIGVGLLIGSQLLRSGSMHPASMLATVVCLVAVHTAFDPSPATVDLLGILATAALTTRRAYVAVLVLAVVWANFSTGALWVVPAFLCFAGLDDTMTVSRKLAWLCMLVLSLCLTPRGLSSLRDMAVLFAPWILNEWAFLNGTIYGSGRLSLPTLAGLSLGLIVISSRNIPTTLKILAAGLTVSGLLTARNLPAASLICCLLLLRSFRCSTDANRHRLLLRCAGLVMSAGLVATRLSGGISGEGERLGWGVADTLDIRFAERDLQQFQQDELKAHCTDISGAGMFLMACPSAKVLDVSEAAIRSGRLKSYSLLNHDLMTGRKAAFIRQDSSEGGWWQALINTDTSLLVVSPEREAIVTSLEPTLWKPLSLDAPQLFFASTAMPQFGSQILQARAMRDMVEFGEWKHELYHRSIMPSHTDLWATLGGSPDYRADLRQARVFRAMQMPMGSARTLLPVLRNDGLLRGSSEFTKTQQLLAWNEWLNCGHVSMLRRQALAYWCEQAVVPGVAADDLNVDQKTSLPAEAIRLYCSGEPDSAADLLTTATPEFLYAKHCLHWEAGDGMLADAARKSLEIGFPKHPLTAMTRMLRDVE